MSSIGVKIMKPRINIKKKEFDRAMKHYRSARQFAFLMEVSPQFISQIRNRQRAITPEMSARIMADTGIDVVKR